MRSLRKAMTNFYSKSGRDSVAGGTEADADLRRQVVTTLWDALVEADDRETRAEAQALLIGMGELPC